MAPPLLVYAVEAAPQHCYPKHPGEAMHHWLPAGCSGLACCAREMQAMSRGLHSTSLSCSLLPFAIAECPERVLAIDAALQQLEPLQRCLAAGQVGLPGC